MSAVQLREGRYDFVFDRGWLAEKYDDWSHYETLKGLCVRAGRVALKACDFVATNGHKAYLIEVKDYGYPGAAAPADLPQVISLKALDTLAGLVSARAKGGQESLIARKALSSQSIKLVVAIGMPEGVRKLMPPQMFLANVRQSIHARTKAVLPH